MKKKYLLKDYVTQQEMQINGDLFKSLSARALIVDFYIEETTNSLCIYRNILEKYELLEYETKEE